MHALAYHAQAFLDGFLEGAANGHNLAYRFHRRAYGAVDTVEFAEVPARYLHHYIVKGRLEEGRGFFGYGVLEVEQAIAQTQFGGHECQRIAGGFRCQGRRTAQSGVHLDYAVVHRLRVVGILHVTFAHNAYMAYDFDCK